MATIEKRSSGGKTTYRVKIRLKGFPQESATFERLTDAREWATKTEADMKAGRYFGGAKLHTFRQLCDEYERAAQDLKSFEDRKHHLATWRSEFGRDLLSDLTPQRILRARDKLMADGGRSGSTVNRYLATLSACMSFAVKRLGWLERNPCMRVPRFKENPGRIRYLTKEELPRLLDACRKWPDLYLAVVLSLTTGGRQSEIMGLRWSQIDFGQRVITLNHGETKNNDARTLPLACGEAVDLLRERAKVRRIDDDRVFPPLIPGAKNRLPREAWERALKAAGITDFRWHDLRHSAASYLTMAGVSAIEVARVLGHKTLEMALRYSHLDHEHIVALGDKLAEHMNLAGTK